MSKSRREFMQWAGSASALALMSRGWVVPLSLEGAGAGFEPKLLPSMEQVWDWQVWMAKLGPKYTGNDAHRTFVEFCAKNVQSLGLDLSRDHYTLPRWDARRWGLKASATGGRSIDIAVTGYYPYSGQTGKEGVTGPLVYAGKVATGRDASLKIPADVNGKIVFADVPLDPTPYEEWWKPWGFYTLDTKYPSNSINGTWAIRVPMLADLKKAGARGVIFGHTNISDAQAALLYAPFGRALQDIPGLWVGRGAGDQLRKLAGTGGSVTLSLEADVFPDTPTETLIATLPGTSADEVIIVNTHTDGPNATEENGPIGLLALAKYFSQLPKSSRKRTLVFVFATGHFAGAYVPSIRGVVQKHPDLIKKAVGALTVEHLGCREWLDDASMKYVATGKDELTIAITEFESTARVMLDAWQGSGDRRSVAVVPTPNGGFNGEGGALSRADVPTIGYIPIPSYLLAGPQDGCIDKLSRTLLYQQIQVLTKVLARMDGMSAAELKGRGRSTV